MYSLLHFYSSCIFVYCVVEDCVERYELFIMQVREFTRISLAVFSAGLVCYVLGSLILGGQGHADNGVRLSNWWSLSCCHQTLCRCCFDSQHLAQRPHQCGSFGGGPLNTKVPMASLSHSCFRPQMFQSQAQTLKSKSFKASIQCRHRVGMWVDINDFRVVTLSWGSLV